ncbi:MAG: 2-hydroxychromene-2-carboxylate isomerase [Ferrovibrionaceae bacterium]
MSRLEFFYDCSSPWTYLAFEQVQPIAERYGLAITWRPILVGGIFNTINPSVYESRENPVPAKAAYMRKDLQDWAAFAGLTIHFPQPVFPVNSVKAMRGAIVMAELGLQVRYARAVFEAYWRDRLDIAQGSVLADIALRLGQDPADFLAAIDTQPIRQALRANTDEVIARGGFGSPTMFLDGDMFFGNDRLVLIEARLKAASQL